MNILYLVVLKDDHDIEKLCSSADSTLTVRVPVSHEQQNIGSYLGKFMCTIVVTDSWIPTNIHEYLQVVNSVSEQGQVNCHERHTGVHPWTGKVDQGGLRVRQIVPCHVRVCLQHVVQQCEHNLHALALIEKNDSEHPSNRKQTMCNMLPSQPLDCCEKHYTG